MRRHARWTLPAMIVGLVSTAQAQKPEVEITGQQTNRLVAYMSEIHHGVPLIYQWVPKAGSSTVLTFRCSEGNCTFYYSGLSPSPTLTLEVSRKYPWGAYTVYRCQANMEGKVISGRELSVQFGSSKTFNLATGVGLEFQDYWQEKFKKRFLEFSTRYLL